jgi:hypothetical protein
VVEVARGRWFEAGPAEYDARRKRIGQVGWRPEVMDIQKLVHDLDPGVKC